jgi:heme exporter protein A
MEESGSASPSWVIRVQGLTKSFGNHLALKGIDLEVSRGESVVIFGPNGAGKTTLIKVLATIMNPSSGKILVDGLDLKDNAEDIRRSIGIVTHQTFLYGNLTAYENLEFYSRMYDVPDRRGRIRKLVDMVGMTHRLNDRVGTFSRGMQQRLSIARALLHKPSIILLDEPETGLDQQANTMLWQALRDEGEAKPTVILTTHNLERGLEQCERLFILVQGKIAYEASKQSLDLADLRKTYQQYTGVGL